MPTVNQLQCVSGPDQTLAQKGEADTLVCLHSIVYPSNSSADKSVCVTVEGLFMPASDQALCAQTSSASASFQTLFEVSFKTITKRRLPFFWPLATRQ